MVESLTIDNYCRYWQCWNSIPVVWTDFCWTLYTLW